MEWNTQKSVLRLSHTTAKSFNSVPFHFMAHFSELSNFLNGTEHFSPFLPEQLQNSFVLWNSSISFCSVLFSWEGGFDLCSLFVVLLTGRLSDG